MEAYSYILPCYVHSQRGYHDINHINRMLQDACRYDINVDPHLYYAILFHDIIYNTSHELAADNEKMSAKIFKNWASHTKDFPYDVNRISSMILATQHHFDGTEYEDKQTNILLDLDLLSFADSWRKFIETQKKIDYEYLLTNPYELVVEKRKEFLENILKNKSLKYRVLDEDGTKTRIAYENIQYLIDNWSQYYD